MVCWCITLFPAYETELSIQWWAMARCLHPLPRVSPLSRRGSLSFHLVPPYTAVRQNHRRVKKKLRSQRQTTANSVKELVCKDWGHNVSFFPVLQGIMDLPCLWKLRIMVHKSPVCPFPTFIVIELRKRKGGGRSSMEQILVSSLRHSSWPTMGTPISFKMWALIWPLSLSFTSQQVVVLFGKPLSLTSKPIFSAVLWAAVCGGHSWPAPPSRLSKLRTIVGTGRLEQGEETAHSC